MSVFIGLERISLEDTRGDFRVHVAPGDDHGHRRALHAGHLPGEESGHAGRPTRLRRELRALVEEAEARADLLLRHQYRLDAELAAELQRQVAREGRVEAV